MKIHAFLLIAGASLPTLAVGQARFLDPEISYIAAYTFQKNSSVFVERCASDPATQRQIAEAMDRFKAKNPDYVAAAANSAGTPHVLAELKELDASFESYKSHMLSMFKTMKNQDICNHAANGLERDVFATRVKKTRDRLNGAAAANIPGASP